MNFIIYNLLLLLACIPALLILSIGLMVPLLPLLLFAKSKTLPPKALIFLLRGLAVLSLIYFSANWAAFCVTLAYKYINKPEVTWDWLYFVFGFIWCLSLSRYWAKSTIEGLFRGEQPPTPLMPIMSLFKLSMFYVAYIAQITSIVAYIGFAIYPNLMRVPYGWLSILFG